MTPSKSVSNIRSAVPRGPVIIRDAKPDDLDGIAELQTRTIMAFGVETYGEETCRAWAKIGVQVRHTLLASGTFFVAEWVDTLAGISGWTADSREPDCAWPRYVFVSPTVARHGIGRKLMQAVEHSVHAAGRTRLQVWASLNAVGFYEALGYRRVRPARWPVAAGIEMAFLLMEKPLASPAPGQ